MRSAIRLLIFTLCVSAMSADAFAGWQLLGGKWSWFSGPTQPYTPPATGGTNTGSSGGYSGGGSTGGGTPAVPEPGTVLLMASGIAAVAVVRRRRKNVVEQPTGN